MHYNYLCNLSDPICTCPENKTCAIGMSDSLYHEMIRYGLMQEVDTFCEFVGSETGITVSFPHGDTSYSPNFDWICSIGIGYGCLGCPNPGGGGGGELGDGCFGCDSIPDQTPPRCLDTTLWERMYHIPGFYNDYVGLYFGVDTARVDLNKPVVLLVHGLNGTCERWEDNYVPWLKSRGYRVASVDLFKVNSVVPLDYYGGGFYPNTKLLDTLVRRLHSYIVNTYSSGKHDIVVIAHSRGGLEAEGALLLKKNPYITKVITIGTPFYGTSLADLCMDFENTFQCGTFDILCHTIKTILKSLGIEVASVCNILADGARLSHAGVATWRMTLGSSDISFNVGIGWTNSTFCEGFSLSNRIGCLLIRYFKASGCNDGAVEYTSTERRESYPNTDLISTRPDVSSDVRCSGNPQEWKKDHTASASDYTIFRRYIYPRIGSGLYTYNVNMGENLDGVDLLSYMSEPVMYLSNGLLTVIPYSAIRGLPINREVLIVSPSPINILGASDVDTVDMESKYAYKVFPSASGVQITVQQEMGGGSQELTSVENNPLMVFYLSGAPAVMWLPHRGVLVDEPVQVKLYHSSSTSGASLIVWKYGDSLSTAKTFNLEQVGDTFVTTLSIHEPGIYNLMAWTTGINPKTIIGLLYVFASSDEDDITSLILGGTVPGVEKKSIESTPGSSERLRSEGDFLVVEKERGMYKIYSPSGSLLRKGKFQNGRVPIHDLPRGVYFVVIEGKVYKILR